MVGLVRRPDFVAASRSARRRLCGPRREGGRPVEGACSGVAESSASSSSSAAVGAERGAGRRFRADGWELVHVGPAHRDLLGLTVSRCRTAGELLDVYAAERGHFDDGLITKTIVRLAHVTTREPTTDVVVGGGGGSLAEASEELRTLVDEARSLRAPAYIAAVARALGDLSPFYPAAQARLATLRGRIASRVVDYTAADLSRVATGFARGGVAAPALFDVMAAQLMARLADAREAPLTPRQLSNLALAYVRRAEEDRSSSSFSSSSSAYPELFEAIARHFAPVASSADPQTLANTAWALAKVFGNARSASSFASSSSSEAPPLADDDDRPWSRALAGPPAVVDEVFAAMGARAAEDVEAIARADLRFVATLAWAFAAGRRRGFFLPSAAAESEAAEEGPSSPPPSLPPSLPVTVPVPVPVPVPPGPKEDVFAACAGALVRRGGGANSHLEALGAVALCNVAWAFAASKTAAAHPALFVELGKVLSLDRVAATLDAGQIADVTVAFTEARVDASAVLEATATRAAALAETSEASPREVATTLVAFARWSQQQQQQQQQSKEDDRSCSGLPPRVSGLFEAAARAIPRRVGDFAPRDLADTAWAFSAAGVSAPGLFEAIAAEAVGRVDCFGAKDLSLTAWAFATARDPACPALFAAIARAAQRGGTLAALTPAALANTAWAFTTAAVDAPDFYEAVAVAALAKVDDFTPQGLANTVWAFAAARRPLPSSSSRVPGRRGPLDLFEAVAWAARAKMGAFKPQELANTAWAFSRVRVRAPALFAAIEVEVARRAGDFAPAELSSTAVAFARAGFEAPALYEALARAFLRAGIGRYKPPALTLDASAQGQAVTLFVKNEDEEAAPLVRVGDFTPQTLANVAWAYAKVGIRSPSLFDAIAASTVRSAVEFLACEVAMTAWAFATARFVDRALFFALAEEVAYKAGDFAPQELAMTAWAFATAGAGTPELFDCLAREAVVKVQGFKPQELAMTAWAFSHSGHHAPVLYEAVARCATRLAYEFEPRELSMTAWAFARAGRRPGDEGDGDDKFWAPASEEEREAIADARRRHAQACRPLFRAIADAARPQLGAFKPQELANTAYAFSKLRVPAPDLYDEIAAHANSRLDEFNPTEHTMLEWAYARYPALFT